MCPVIRGAREAEGREYLGIETTLIQETCTPLAAGEDPRVVPRSSLCQEIEESNTRSISLAAPTVKGLCELAGVSRRGYYRFLSREPKPADPDRDIRQEIEEILQEMPSYGYRPTTKELHRRGSQVNIKKVLRLMREDNHLCRKPKRWVGTTDSNHPNPTYPNLLQRQYVSLAVLLDVYSRRVIGWALEMARAFGKLKF